MLLALDVGNTNIVAGLFDLSHADPAARAKPLATWRTTTRRELSADEFGLLLNSLFTLNGFTLSTVTGLAISSVVPPLDSALRLMADRFFHLKPLFVEPGIKTGLPILTDNPTEVGADRIVNCVAAWDRFHAPSIIVDMGTATKFDVVSRNGEFLGGAIAPGLGISADALFNRAAKLPRVDIRKPAKIIGTGTVDNMQIGLYYGYIGLVDGILERMIAELTVTQGQPPRILTTGGLARLIADGSKYIHEVDELLTLTGLRLLFEKNMALTHDRHHDRVSHRRT